MVLDDFLEYPVKVFEHVKRDLGNDGGLEKSQKNIILCCRNLFFVLTPLGV